MSLPQQSLVMMWSYTSSSFAATQWTSWGNDYYTPTTPNLGFPSTITFSMVPYGWVGGRVLHADAWLCSSSSTLTETKIGNVYAIRPNKPTVTITLEPHYLIIGRYSSYTPST